MSSTQIKKTLLLICSFTLLFLLVALTLTSCQPISAKDVADDLFPNLWVLLTHAFACVFLFIVIMWLVWKPTKESLEKRRKYIAAEIAEAERVKHEAFMKLQYSEQQRVQAHLHAKTIIENATSQAYVVKETIENEGKVNAKKIINDANEQVIRMQEEVKSNNEKQILDIAFSATEALLQKEISKDDNQKIVKQFIDKLSNEQWKGAK